MLLSVTLHVGASREGLIAGGTGKASSTNRVAMMCRRLRECAAGISIGGHVHGWINSVFLGHPDRIESSDGRIIVVKGDLGGFGEMCLNVGVEGVP